MKMKDSKLTKFIKKELVHGVGRNGSKPVEKEEDTKIKCSCCVKWQLDG